MYGIYVNPTRDVGCVNAKKLASMLDSASVPYAFIGDKCGMPGVRIDDVAESLEMVIAFGGDGTMLNIVKQLIHYSIPVLGVNVGNLGFLTEIEVSDMEETLRRLIAKDYSIEERAMLLIEADGKKYYAVNECSLTRGYNTHTISIDLVIDGKYADRVIGDGAMVSTPTGSTAYSLSCGGAILSPELDLMAVLAICPHTLHSRPMVISGNSKVEMIANTAEGELVLNVDSESVLLKPNGKTIRVVVSKADKNSRFVRLNEQNFYNKLLNKMNYWNNASREK